MGPLFLVNLVLLFLHPQLLYGFRLKDSRLMNGTSKRLPALNLSTEEVIRILLFVSLSILTPAQNIPLIYDSHWEMDNESIQSTCSNPQTVLYSDEFFRCNLMMRNLMGIQIKMSFKASNKGLSVVNFLQ